MHEREAIIPGDDRDNRHSSRYPSTRHFRLCNILQMPSEVEVTVRLAV